MTHAFIFPGQGSQVVGMGKALADAFPVAKAVFDEVDDALGENLSAIMWDGPIETLTLTTNAQPALMAHSIAATRVLEAETDLKIEEAAFVAGHSLGEYSALCAAGAISLVDAARVLNIRGKAMQEAAPEGEGAMAAVLGLDLAQVEAGLANVSSQGVCEIANDNAPGQIVISGASAAIDEAAKVLKEAGAKMVKKLPVSASFHSSMMAPAADVMEAALAEIALSSPNPQLVANVTAAAVTDADQIRRQLVEQVTGRVRWTESIQTMISAGVGSFVELGSGKVLTGLTRRIDKTTKGFNLAEPADLEALGAL